MLMKLIAGYFNFLCLLGIFLKEGRLLSLHMAVKESAQILSGYFHCLTTSAQTLLSLPAFE